MIYKGVEFTVTAVAPGIWKWQFRIGDRVIAGKTEAKLNLLAIRRVQLRIDRELKKAERELARVAGSFCRSDAGEVLSNYSGLRLHDDLAHMPGNVHGPVKTRS